MSRLSALKEFSFMKVLRENGFGVPEPVAHSRHTVVMELVDAFPLRQIQSVPDPAGLYAELISIMLRLASFGLIHGDFNEFNILLREDEISHESKEQLNEAEENFTPKDPEDRIFETEQDIPKKSLSLVPVIIDFPQMVSIDHANAQMYFDRDVNCIKKFFERRFHFVSDEPGPYFVDAKRLAGGKKTKRLDVEVEASGFSKKMAKELEKYMQAVGAAGESGYDDTEQIRHESEEESSEASEEASEETQVSDFQVERKSPVEVENLRKVSGGRGRESLPTALISLSLSADT